MDIEFSQLIENSIELVKKHYHHLHQNPELSFQEFETSKYIQEELLNLGISYKANIAGTGLLGVIKGRNPQKKIIALRADMDALPINEENNISYKSIRTDVMHACGHDVHTACLLGAAKILNHLKDRFEGTILLIFQPGEEKAPGGAHLMLEDGIFEHYTPQAIIGQHVSVDYPVGTMAFLPGKIMASADEIYITVKGKGGHGALPHLCNDTILAASQTIVALQQVKSRLCHPTTPMVLTFGKIIGNGSTNVIPDEVKIVGTFRTVDETWRADAKNHIKRIATETCAAYGCTADIEIPDGYPCVVNNEKVTNEAKRFAEDFIGEENVKELQLRMTSEDFGFFSQKYPSCFYRFGVKGNNNINSGGLHTSNFCIDEESLKIGVGGLAWIAWKMMS